MRRFFVGFAILAIAVQSPHWAAADDQQIAEHIVQRLKTEKSKGSLRDFNIGLRVEDGAVYLSGYVASRTQEKLALDAARTTEGVQQVFNEIEIAARKATTKKEPTPKEAAPKVAKLDEPKPAKAEPLPAKASKLVSALKLERKTTAEKTETSKPSKLVSALKSKEKATEDKAPAAKSVAKKDASKGMWNKLNEAAKNTFIPKTGLTKANAAKTNNVKTAELKTGTTKKTAVVPASNTREDSMAEAKRIATEIIEKFRVEKQKGNLRKFGIDVEVDNGVVWLKGHVTYPEHQELALDIARRVAGVTQVVNDLRVKEGVAGTPSREDDQIAREIVNMLQTRKQSGQLRGFGIDVQVEQGAVWLSGYVADSRQQKIVLEAARRVRGVREVVNDISIESPTPVADPATAASMPTPASRPIAPAVPVQYTNGGGSQTPLAFAPAHPANHQASVPGSTPVPMMGAASGVGIAPARYDHPQMPGYAWPSYAAHPNYGAVTYPQQYSASAWPYIGPFYPYPQVPLGWRKVTLEWDDGWWQLDFKDRQHR